ncbi:S8 family serine peptidase [Sulfitobacter sp. AS92]|uniref:S8 family serine peptidase n=1 Tax=Sulfitobacter sp. AS92 TaxID=3135783 RepID=UPI003174BC32
MVGLRTVSISLLLASIPFPIVAQSADGLRLPKHDAPILDAANSRNQMALSKIESYTPIDFLELGEFESIIVEYAEPTDDPFVDGQALAAAASLGVTATQLAPNTFELQISSLPISASEFDVDGDFLRQKRAETVAGILENDETIEDWFPNYRVDSQEITDPLYAQQWHYSPNDEILGGGKFPGGTDLSSLWEWSSGSDEVVVAVLDTGFLYHHEDAANVVPGYDFVSDLTAANDGDGWDSDAEDPGDACGPLAKDSWHGSHVAGIIGALGHNGKGAVGITPKVSIMPVRVLGKCGGDFRDIMTAVLWSADLLDSQTLMDLGLPRVQKKADIINMSLGGVGRCRPSFGRNFLRVAESGTLIIVAAGNSARNVQDFIPASCPGVMAVAASDMSGSLASRYSNYGPLISIMAPGGDIDADLDGNGLPDGILSMVANDYAFYNGTSMAAPHVSGLAAHIYALDPTIAPNDAINLMVNYGLKRSDQHCPVKCGTLLSAKFLLPE